MSEKPTVSPHHKIRNKHESEQSVVHRDCGVDCGPGECCRVVGSHVLPVEGAEESNIAGGDIDELTADIEQEVERIVALPTYQPTKSEYDEHCVTHNPYRPWCRHCVEGRAQEFPHFKKKCPESSRVPLVAFDYAGVTDKGDVVTSLDPEWSSEGVVRILVAAIRTPDDMQSCIFGHVVPQKGIDLNQYAVDCLVDDIL